MNFWGGHLHRLRKKVERVIQPIYTKSVDSALVPLFAIHAFKVTKSCWQIHRAPRKVRLLKQDWPMKANKSGNITNQLFLSLLVKQQCTLFFGKVVRANRELPSAEVDRLWENSNRRPPGTQIYGLLCLITAGKRILGAIYWLTSKKGQQHDTFSEFQEG